MAKQQLFDAEGNPIRKKKKWPFILGAIVVVGIIGSQAGGGEDKKTADSSNPSQNATQQQEETTVTTTVAPTTVAPTEATTEAVAVFGVGMTQTVADVEMKFLSLDVSTSNDADKVYLLPEFEIINNSKKDVSVSSILSFDMYIDGYSTTNDLSAQMATDKESLNGSAAPGKKVKGVIGIEAPSDWQELEIIFTPSVFGSKEIVWIVNP